MGCGQSRIGSIYSKNRKNKDSSRKNSDSIGSGALEQKNGSVKSNKTNNNGMELNRNEDHNGIDVRNQKKKTGGSGNGPLLHQAEVSSSQLDFFRMLDEKIESGPDYDESSDGTVPEGISDLLRRWELTGMTWSSFADLTTPPDNLGPTEVLRHGPHHLSARDREGMRNIIGGRPETAPVFMTSPNRADGLQDNLPTNLHKHQLEVISQSPTLIPRHRLHDPMDYKVTPQAPYQNGDLIRQQAMYREQYLQQTGIIVQPQYQRNNSYSGANHVQQLRIGQEFT